MDLATFKFLLTPAGQVLLSEAAERRPTEESLLRDLSALRRRYPPQQAAAALEMVRLRERAAAKFSQAQRMYFTRAALEQASGEAIAAYRAARYGKVGARRIADLGCGIGGDSSALAAGAQVLGVDQDALRLAMAQANLSALGLGGNFQPVQADLTGWTPPAVDALFFDPGRRDSDGRRIRSVLDYRPPLPLIDRWLPLVPCLGVKISPGVDYAELPPGAEVEFISESGVVKEAVLWFGELASGVSRRATLLPEGVTLVQEPHGEIPVGPPKAYLYEPDGAVIRAHLVEGLAERLNASKLDPDIAYLTADVMVDTPFARAYAIESYMPFNLKKLRAHLRELMVGRVVVKKRGSPIDPEELIRRLRLRGERERVLFLTHLDGQPVVIVGKSVPGSHRRRTRLDA
jgi:SAM-dependent methyltransferase